MVEMGCGAVGLGDEAAAPLFLAIAHRIAGCMCTGEEDGALGPAAGAVVFWIWEGSVLGGEKGQPAPLCAWEDVLLLCCPGLPLGGGLCPEGNAGETVGMEIWDSQCWYKGKCRGCRTQGLGWVYRVGRH